MRQQAYLNCEMTTPSATTGRRRPPRGFSMLEFVVAMTIFAIALAGLFPLLAEYAIQAQRLEKCSPACGRWKQNADKTWTFQATDPVFAAANRYKELPSEPDNQYAYPCQWNVLPADDPWMWKLGAQASLVPDKPADLLAAHTPYLRPFPYTNTVTPAVLIDDESAHAADLSGWIEPSPQAGYLNTCRRQTSAATESWVTIGRFTNVQPGWYKLLATWPDPNATQRPDPPNDNPISNVAYQILDGTGSTVLRTSDPSGVNQTVAPSGETIDGVGWNRIIGGDVGIYVPKRVVEGANDNLLSRTDINGHAVMIYNGDTILVQIKVPTSPPSGFITADGTRLVALPPNTIRRLTPLKWTWKANDERTVTAKVTVTK